MWIALSIRRMTDFRHAPRSKSVSGTCMHAAKVVLYRDTGSVEPGSRQFFGSVSGSEPTEPNQYICTLQIILMTDKI